MSKRHRIAELEREVANIVSELQAHDIGIGIRSQPCPVSTIDGVGRTIERCALNHLHLGRHLMRPVDRLSR